MASKVFFQSLKIINYYSDFCNELKFISLKYSQQTLLVTRKIRLFHVVEYKTDISLSPKETTNVIAHDKA